MSRHMDEPVMIDGLVCAQTLERIGLHRQAGWCRNADAMLKRAGEEHERIAAERDALYQRLIAYEPPPKPFVSEVRWTGD